MDKSSSQALVTCSSCVLECRESNLYAVHTVITLEVSHNFRSSITRTQVCYVRIRGKVGVYAVVRNVIKLEHI